MKTRSKRNRKIGFFPKGLVHGFGLKMGFFPPFYFRQIRQEKRLSSLKQQHVQKVEKLRYFQRSWPMVLVQKWPFFQRFLFWPYSRKSL